MPVPTGTTFDGIGSLFISQAKSMKNLALTGPPACRAYLPLASQFLSCFAGNFLHWHDRRSQVYLQASLLN
ncbi:MAG: hypothetical protein RR686_18960 [Morganella sp. (in: enterobacteria)]